MKITSTGCIPTFLQNSLRAIKVAALLSFGAPVMAQGAELRFCFNDWPPYTSEDAKGIQGISIDIIRAAAAKSGLSVSFEKLPWNRCLEMVRQGGLDGVIDAAKRPNFLQGPASFSAYTNTFWVDRDSALQHFEPAGLSGKTVGLVSGYTYPADLLGILSKAQVTIDYSVDDGTNIRKLAFGRVDAIVADYANTKFLTHTKNLTIRALAPTHSSDNLYPSLNSALTVEHAALNAALEALLRDGTVDQIYRDHLGIGFDELGVK